MSRREFNPMELTKSFPPADDLYARLQQVDYKKHLNKYMDIVETIVLYTAAIATVIFQKVSNMKFSTPASIANYFYFNVDFRDMMTKLNDECDEIIGFSIGRLYIGLYSNCIQWGILDENGAL